MSFSQHVALHKYSIAYYIALFSVVLPLLLLFLLGWFMPEYNLSAWFGFFVASSAAAQFACTLIPEVGGWKSYYHRLLASVSAVMLVPALLILLFSETINTPARIITLASLLIMTSIIYRLVVSHGKHRMLLVIQSVYYAAFFAPILFLAYLQ